MKKKTFIVIIEGKVYSNKVYALIESLIEGIPQDSFELIKVKDGNNSALQFYNRLSSEFGVSTYYLEKRSNSYIKVLKDPFILQLTEVLGGSYSKDEIVLDDIAVNNSARVIKNYVTDAYPKPVNPSTVPSTNPNNSPTNNASSSKSNLIYYILGGGILLFALLKKTRK